MPPGVELGSDDDEEEEEEEERADWRLFLAALDDDAGTVTSIVLLRVISMHPSTCAFRSGGDVP